MLSAVSYVLVLAIVAFGVPLALNLSARVNAEVRTQALAQADLIAATASDLLAPPARRQLAILARSAAEPLHGRVLIVDRAGRVIADSAGPAELGSGYGSRPELVSALRGRTVQVRRSSRTLGRQILATAVPIIHRGRPVAAVRVTQSVAAVSHAVQRVELELALVAAVVLAVGLAAGALLASQIALPLRRLEATARRVAQGDLRATAAVEGSSEQRSLASSFNDMTERVAGLLAGQRAFVADASHQLRTPLTGLRLRLESARAAAADDDAAADLEAAIAEVDRLSHTVDEMLLLSRDGRRRSSGARVDLAAVAQDAMTRWRPEASHRNVALAGRREGASGGMVWAARADLERALDVLVENAIRYSPPSSTVTIVTAPGRIEVLDRGPGVPADERELVFERFRRGGAGRAAQPGHGLGLPIARELVREWEGEVTIGARRGGGTAAVISFAVSDRFDASPAGFAGA